MSTQNDARQPTIDPTDLAYDALIQARALRSAYLASLVRSAARAAVRWVNHRRTLIAVEDLSPRMLADIGLDATALKAGVVRRAEDERVEDFVRRPQNAAVSHVNAGAAQGAANNDIRDRTAA